MLSSTLTDPAVSAFDLGLGGFPRRREAGEPDEGLSVAQAGPGSLCPEGAVQFPGPPVGEGDSNSGPRALTATAPRGRGSSLPPSPQTLNRASEPYLPRPLPTTRRLPRPLRPADPGAPRARRVTGPRVGHISPGRPLSLCRRLSAAVWKAGTGSRVWDRSGGACPGGRVRPCRGGACPAEAGPEGGVPRSGRLRGGAERGGTWRGDQGGRQVRRERRPTGLRPSWPPVGADLRSPGPSLSTEGRWLSVSRPPVCTMAVRFQASSSGARGRERECDPGFPNLVCLRNSRGN